jgi:hypothetical protein
MRLRNRIVKATYWTSGELCRWHRDKRDFYRSLWACAEDSCCVEDDMFEVKMTAWPSPLDADMSVERFETWRDELIEAGKIVPYEVDGRRYLYLPDMARHETPRNPQKPDLPMPPWVTYTTTGQGRSSRTVYTHSDPTDPTPPPHCDRSATVQTTCGNRSTSPVLSCPVRSGSVQNLDQTPLSSRSPEPERKERGSYPQAWQGDSPKTALSIAEEKVDRPLTLDEQRSIRRWVRMGGARTTETALADLVPERGLDLPYIGTCIENWSNPGESKAATS